MCPMLVNVVIDTVSPGELARFWTALLDWPVAVDEHDEIDLRAPGSNGWPLDLTFVPVPEPKQVKNRLHLDLASSSEREQRALVDRACALGARPLDIGQGDVPWVVLADPHGNEFCVLEPRAEYADTGALAAIVVDTADPAGLATFWAGAAGLRPVPREGGVAALRAADGRGPWLEFLPVTDPKTTKNRLHLDIGPAVAEDFAAEFDALLAAGAQPIDVGQGETPWTVLADPQGNEFCLLRGH